MDACSSGRGVVTFSERPDVALEMLAVAQRLRGTRAETVTSLLIDQGEGTVARAEEERRRGADEVRVLSSAGTAPSCAADVATVLAEVIRSAHPWAVLIGGTRNGAEVGARLGQRLGLASPAMCSAVAADDDGNLVVERLVFGGRFVATQSLRGSPRLAVLQPNRFEPLTTRQVPPGRIVESAIPARPSRVSVIDLRERERAGTDITQADVIVSAGRGLRGKEDLALLRDLARALGGELAGSRPLVEAGWIPADRQVGLSGLTVKPVVYIACGISGQIEHIAGMRSSRIVVAINSDPTASIHQEADYSVIGDLYKIVPELIAVVEEARRGRAARVHSRPAVNTRD